MILRRQQPNSPGWLNHLGKSRSLRQIGGRVRHPRSCPESSSPFLSPLRCFLVSRARRKPLRNRSRHQRRPRLRKPRRSPLSRRCRPEVSRKKRSRNEVRPRRPNQEPQQERRRGRRVRRRSRWRLPRRRSKDSGRACLDVVPSRNLSRLRAWAVPRRKESLPRRRKRRPVHSLEQTRQREAVLRHRRRNEHLRILPQNDRRERRLNSRAKRNRPEARKSRKNRNPNRPWIGRHLHR